jgi:hypothetical protein
MSRTPPPIPPYPHSAPGPIGPNKWEPRGSAGFTIGDSFSAGWAALKANYWRLLGAMLLVGVTSIATSFVLQLLPVIGAVLDQIASLFLAPFAVSLVYTNVRAVRGENPNALLFFSDAWPRYWGLVGVTVLTWLIMVGVMLPFALIAVLAGVLGASGGGALTIFLVIAFVLLVAIPLLLYLQARLSFAGVLYMDAPPGRLGVIDSITLSWRRTAPFAWALVGLHLLLAIIVLGSFLLLFLPAIFLGFPILLACIAAAYTQIFPKSCAGLCPNCGYDCRSSPPGTCPECGTLLPA